MICNLLPPVVLESCSVGEVDLFIRLCVHFRREIKLHVPPESDRPPYKLPPYLHEFLVGVLRIDSPLVEALWKGLQDAVWEWPVDQIRLTDEETSRINLVGAAIPKADERLAECMFYPPIEACLVCDSKLSSKSYSKSRVCVRFYSTTGRGGLNAVKGYSTSFKCRDCKIRYYHNYYTDDNIRIFYSPEIPRVVQIEDHAFVETELCELFTSLMLFAWVSSQNCANILNASVKRTSTVSSNTSDDLSISSEQVFRAFVLNGLLRECYEQGTTLLLPDLGDHDDRLKAAMELRTRNIIAHGQKERMHACNKCEKPLPLEGSGHCGLQPFRACVTDGISLGRPCCKVHNCKAPLPTNRAHFCVEHEEHKAMCVIAGCSSKNETGFQTCAEPAHRSIETHRKERGKAFFQLSARLKNQFNSTQLANSLATKDDDVPDMEDENYSNPNTHGSDTRKSESGNRPRKTNFARRRTHNEQLVVACCGVILGRATMYGAEAISGVKDFLKSVFDDPRDLPNVIFYDNNCQLQSHLRSDPKDVDYFKNVILPVDVFHFKSKHSITDEFCQKHCNPAMWPELVDDEGKWKFNSSIAEQVNAWLGGYLSIVRDMLAYRYDFFLDEMIKRRNEMIVERQWDNGDIPYHIPSHRG
ncbi:hypothetical protein CPC08DRAFT_824622 [Agrocybe pediades]|nr:hypothetical protein CPC08DRAFT_824622 [Agrocybe pediades]